MEIIPKSRKGIMLTLATVVLFVLMLAELVTYVSLNINYNVIVSSSSAVAGGASAVATLNSAVPVFLHQSLQNALSSLIQYVGTPTIRKGHFINNTAYVLQSLMYNGTIANGINVGNFNGQSSYISTISKSISLPNGASVAVWVNYGGITSGCPMSFGFNPGNPVGTGWFYIDGGCNSQIPYLDYAGASTTEQDVAFGSLATGTWHFLVATYSSGALTAYLDGQQVGSPIIPSSLLSTVTGLSISGQYFNGQAANIQLYNVVLTPSQIASLYSKGISGAPIIPTNIVGWWPLNGDANDNSGNGNNGVPTNVMFSNTVQYLSSTMRNSTFSGFMSRISNQISNEGFNVVITNATLNVFQNSPFTISANYTALVVINSTRGLSTFPLAATASVSLNGTPSLYGLETGDPFIIKPVSSYPKVVPFGNVYATSGSATTTLFAYGTAYYASGTPACASIPAQYQNANYILVTPSAASIPSTICGMGGLVTYTANSPAATVPYLVYSSSSNIVNVIQTGTSILLNVNGLSLLNVSSLQSAIQNGYSFASPYVPSYLDWAQGSLTKRSTNGMFSFNLLNRQLATYDGTTGGVTVNSLNGMPAISSSGGAITMAGWAYSSDINNARPLVAYACSASGNAYPNLALDYDVYCGGPDVMSILYLSASYYLDTCLPPPITVGALDFYAVTYNGVGGAAMTYEGAGGKLYSVASTYPLGSNTIPANPRTSIGDAAWFGGISNVQIYSTVLTPAQMSQLYEEGIDGIPISNAGLVGWWPLNGDYNDYSGENNNGIGTSVPFNKLSDYQGDPIWGGSLYNFNALNANALNLTEGVLNCGSSTQCYNPSLRHLYLANVPLTGTFSSTQTEAAALGLANAILPP